MSYITLGYKCTSCPHEEEKLIKKKDREKRLFCPVCDGILEEQLSAPAVMKVNMTDAVGAGRFDDVREQRKLQKVARKLRKQGRKGKAEKAIVDKEIQRIGQR